MSDPVLAPGDGRGPVTEGEGRAGSAASLAAWAFAFLVLRVFAVSGYDWDTAFAVSTTIGLDDGLPMLFGTFMAGHLAASVLLALVLPLLVATWLWSPGGRRAAVLLPTALGTVTLAALTVSFRSAWLPATAIAVLGLLALVHRLPERHRLRRASLALMGRVGAVVGVTVLLVAVFTSTPWVPHERIETTDGTVTGHVLSIDSGYLNVLTDEQRFVILVSGDVISRE